MKIKNLILAFVVGVIVVGLAGCAAQSMNGNVNSRQYTTIQVEGATGGPNFVTEFLGATTRMVAGVASQTLLEATQCGPRPVMSRPVASCGTVGGYYGGQRPPSQPYGGGYPSFSGYGQQPYGGGCYQSQNRLYRGGQWIDQRALSCRPTPIRPQFSFWGNRGGGYNQPLPQVQRQQQHQVQQQRVLINNQNINNNNNRVLLYR